MTARWLSIASLSGSLAALVLAAPLFAGAPSPDDPLAPIGAEQWDMAKAAHLLRRAGFGGTPSEILKLSMMTPADAVAHLVDYEKLAAGAPMEFPAFDLAEPATARTYDRLVKRYVRDMLNAARGRALLDLQEALKVEPGKEGAKGAAPQAQPNNNRRNRRRNYRERQPGESVEAYVWRVARLRAVGATRRSMEGQNIGRLRAWWLRRMVATQRPLEEKMTLFWHGHFATGFQTVRNARHMQIQNDTLRKHATGDFRALVKSIARDPAMLRYLDGNRNVKGRPNENFARELMELFTIGKGNYTEADIKQAARAFTGWSYRGNQFIFSRRRHDDGQKTFMGKTGTLGGDDVIDIILAREETPKFIAWKLCRFFVADTPEPALVDAVAARLRASNYQLKPVLRSLFGSRAFYASSVVGRGIKSPAELIVGTIRGLELPPNAIGLLRRTMTQMGQELFQPPNVKGWDGGRAWINSSTMLIRYNFSSQLVASAPRVLRMAELARQEREKAQKSAEGGGENMMGGENDMMGGGRDRDSRRERRAREKRIRSMKVQWGLADRLAEMKGPEEVVDHLVARLLARPLDAERRAGLLRLLSPEGAKYDPKDRATRARMQALLVTITSLPEYQLN